MACPLRPTARLLLTSLALLVTAHARAADSSASAAAALKILTQPGHEASAATPPASGHETLTLQRSETLDMLVRRLNPGSPFKDEVFRRALADLNPTTLPNAANNLLKRGSTLQLPNVEDLRRTLLRHYPGTAVLLQPPLEGQAEHDSPSPAGPNKRRWVRFP